MTITDVMSSAAAKVPRFGRTPCQMFPTLFDLDYHHADRAAAATAAVFLCRHECPALRECRRSVLSLPQTQRPAGTVVAGRRWHGRHHKAS